MSQFLQNKWKFEEILFRTLFPIGLALITFGVHFDNNCGNIKFSNGWGLWN